MDGPEYPDRLASTCNAGIKHLITARLHCQILVVILTIYTYIFKSMHAFKLRIRPSLYI